MSETQFLEKCIITQIEESTPKTQKEDGWRYCKHNGEKYRKEEVHIVRYQPAYFAMSPVKSANDWGRSRGETESGTPQVSDSRQSKHIIYFT